MKILVIEQDLDLLHSVLAALKRAGFLCESASDYQSGYRKIANYEYDCVLVEIMLPGGDGLQLVHYLRKESFQTGILILSERGSLLERVQGLEAGADDYLVKPYQFPELLARIKAILRRRQMQPDSELRIGKLVVRLPEREVHSGSTAIPLTRKEYDILLYLIRHKNRVVTKDSIAEYLWGDYMDNAVSFDFIYAHVKNLRKKLASHDCGDYLRTIYGVGYKFQVL